MENLDVFRKIQSIIDKLRIMSGEDNDNDGGEEDGGVFPFSLILDDPAGNSYLENPLAPQADPKMTTSRYERTPNQDMSIGLQPSAAAIEAGLINDSDPSHKNSLNSAPTQSTDDDISKLGREEVMTFPTPCPSCGSAGETNMCVANIPHFKEIIIMSLDCPKCGYRSNEIKGGGAIPTFGTRLVLTVADPEDMGREVLKSDTGGIAIPEIDMELDEGGLDGVYSTVEGLVKKVYERIEIANPFGEGDSGTKNHKGNDGGEFDSGDMGTKWKEFLGRMREYSDGKKGLLVGGRGSHNQVKKKKKKKKG
jgi:zinc finger protein